jgi:ketosteroid isomerase-like protein
VSRQAGTPELRSAKGSTKAGMERENVDELEAFLEMTLPRLKNGHGAPQRRRHGRIAMWSRNVVEFDLLAAGVSNDLGYLVGIEHTTASVGGAPHAAYALRVTTIFRREDGVWKIVHRHADPYDETGEQIASRLKSPTNILASRKRRSELADRCAGDCFHATS